MSIRSEWIDQSENGLRVDVVNGDGIQIVESNDAFRVYVYFSELPRLITVLQDIHNNNNNNNNNNNKIKVVDDINNSSTCNDGVRV